MILNLFVAYYDRQIKYVIVRCLSVLNKAYQDLRSLASQYPVRSIVLKDWNSQCREIYCKHR